VSVSRTMSSTTKTNCSLCGYLCGLTAHLADGGIARLEPDPSRYPYDAAIVKGCVRCGRNLELLDHPMRLNYPMKRVGERGSGQWERISWDQALDEIAARLKALKEDHGAETLATAIGGPHTVYWALHRFMNLFGSPNNMGIGQICWNPHVWADAVTFGWPLDNELDLEKTSCAILWGVNPAESDNSLFWRTIKEYSRSEAPLIVVDPRRTKTAALTAHWLPIRPGADCALALGLLNVIVMEKLFNRQFVDTWCHGFKALERHLAPYIPAVVETLTGVPAASIVETASHYAGSKPATLITGRGIDQIGPNSFQTHRALAILRAITGNVDLAGASHLGEMPDFTPEVDLELSDRLPETQREKQLGGGRWLLQSYQGYDLVDGYIQKHGKRLPVRYLTSAHPNLVWRAMLEGKPYPVRAMIVLASNPLLSQADSRLVYRALKSLDLLVVIDLFRTPTAMLADYVLPAAGSLERAVVQTNAGTANIAYGGDRAVDLLYERRANFDFWRGLGVRMGQETDWSWKTFQESLEDMLAPARISWRDFCETGLYCPPRSYGKFETIDERSGLPAGFATPSDKIELYSAILNSIHAQPLPVHISRAGESKEYPLTLITGARTQPYYASAFRQMESLRRRHPEPLAEMSAECARRNGLAEGQAVWVESPYGRACFRLKIAVMGTDVVSVEYGWWRPELASAEPELGGVWRSNANLLTNADAQKYDNLMGQWAYNDLPCRVYPAEENDLGPSVEKEVVAP
jgi:thiosulfate reductase / polysulfide reductase chain A